jgi:hypothetical protein
MTTTARSRLGLVSRLGSRRRGDPQPDGVVRVVLASGGRPFSPRAAAEAARLAAGGGVAVVSVARIHGSAFGLQNPGLLPSPRERREQREIVAAAIRAVQRHRDREASRDRHGEQDRRGRPAADGQVVVTRNPGKAIARIARIRSARYVVLEPAPGGRFRRLLEGDHVAGVRRRLRAAGAPTVVVVGEVTARARTG